jgi:hypothetical protein
MLVASVCHTIDKNDNRAHPIIWKIPIHAEVLFDSYITQLFLFIVDWNLNLNVDDTSWYIMIL